MSGGEHSDEVAAPELAAASAAPQIAESSRRAAAPQGGPIGILGSADGFV